MKRDLDAVGLSSDLSQALETLAVQDLLCPQLATSALRDDSNRAYFEDLDFTARESSAAKTWAEKLGAWVFPDDPIWQEEFRRRFAVIPDSSFDFLCETGTEVNARVRIDQEKKTVAKGALWYEESLPSETILAGLVWCDQVFPKGSATQEQLMQRFCTAALRLQIGGKATVGKGQSSCLFLEGEASHG